MFVALLLATYMAVCSGDNVMKVTIPDGDSISGSVGSVVPSVDQTVVMENMDRRGLNGLGRGRRLVDCTFFPSAAETPMTISNHCEIGAEFGINVLANKFLHLKGSVTDNPNNYITLTTKSTGRRHIQSKGTVDLSYLRLLHTQGEKTTGGGCIKSFNSGVLKLLYVVLENCVATSQGGAVMLSKLVAQVIMSYVIIRSPVSDGDGGALFIDKCNDVVMDHVEIDSAHAKKW